MLDDLDYDNFIKYLKQQLEEADQNELNDVETLYDFYLDYPPDSFGEPGTEFFYEEVERLIDEQIFDLNKLLNNKESDWLTVAAGKWRLGVSEELNEGKSKLLSRFNDAEEKLFKLSSYEVDEPKRQQLFNLYISKVKVDGSDEEKFRVLKLIADSVKSVAKNENYAETFAKAGEIGSKLNKIGSYKYFVLSAKIYRKKYEHGTSAFYYKKAIDTAKKSEEASVLLDLTRNMRIQYELCGDEDNASEAFKEENGLKAREESNRTKRCVYFVLWLISDYCQSPRRVALWAFGLIVLSALGYAVFGIVPSDSVVQSLSTPNIDFLKVSLDAMYFSIVTFSTLGYGDFTPALGMSRLIANLESLGGLIFTSLFLVTLVRKYGR